MVAVGWNHREGYITAISPFPLLMKLPPPRSAVLFHELVHAFHIERGTLARGKLAENWNAEHQAIGIGEFAWEAVSENRYLENFGLLRLSHHPIGGGIVVYP
jgi:hypothetical protein